MGHRGEGSELFLDHLAAVHGAEARQLAAVTLFAMNRTLPSPSSTFTPPVCLLRAALWALPLPAVVHGGLLGYVVRVAVRRHVGHFRVRRVHAS